ncbi:MAG: multicopper oxidase domain-containing protein, partial [Verrucomicrobiales bacterium]|nr:multicopper oxidase domain-containing protein [Verrucomicrobiales bacterium]
TNAQRQLVYAPSMMEVMTGYLGDVVLVNGTPDAWLSVDRGLYRFRLLNGSTARIYRVALSDGRTFHLIGTDGGLLPAPVSVASVMLAPGQRLEILVDFSGYAVGSTLLLKSLSFPGGGGMMGGTQGVEMDLMRFYVDDGATGNAGLPIALGPFTPYNSALAQRTRQFTLAMAGMVHTINGRLFSMSRVDFSVPFGDLEIWVYRNTSSQFLPMHMHAALCQVLSRSSAAQVAPEDTGWKDTVLVNPNETVRVLVRFDRHTGVFVHHCHNLEHEDSGMMQNFEVLPPPALSIRRQGRLEIVSWPDSAAGWNLQSTSQIGAGADWRPVAQAPVKTNGAWTVTVPEAMDRQFYRLLKL